jgi:NOL1/NOP2/sun family putative RNA methylase
MNKEPISTARKDDAADRLEVLLDHIAHLLPDEAQRQAFKDCSYTPSPIALRLNPLSPNSHRLVPHLKSSGQSIPWCKEGYAFPAGSEHFSHTFEHAVGAFYIQAKAPMLAVEALDPQPGERVLDLCAAPGGKTTQIAAHMHNSGLLIANEMNKNRIPALVGNLERCCVGNAVITQARGTMLARYFHNYFDRILLDAPCSGDGIVRKDLSMLRYWSPEDAQRQAQTQIGLLRAAFHMLRPGGTLVYSTCSLSLEENEHVLLALLNRYGNAVEILPVPTIETLPLPAEISASLPKELLRAVRVWPHLHDTEGALVARLRKNEPTTWAQQESDAHQWEATHADDPETHQAIELLEQLWQFSAPRSEAQVLAGSGRHLLMQPALGDAIKANLPFFVRSGMRIGRRHKQYYYFTQQTAVLWGHLIENRHIDLSWDQVCELFKGQSLSLEHPITQRGEVICRFDSWPLCRAMVEAEGSRLNGMLPSQHYRSNLHRLTY